MTNHPAMFDMSPDGPTGTTHRTSSKNQPTLKAMLSRAIMVGLFGGVALIGLIENMDRFGDPAAIHAERHADSIPANLHPAGQHGAISIQGPRADRLDYGMVQAVPTDLATR